MSEIDTSKEAVERLGMGQRCSLSAREASVTLPSAPWAEKEGDDD